MESCGWRELLSISYVLIPNSFNPPEGSTKLQLHSVGVRMEYKCYALVFQVEKRFVAQNWKFQSSDMQQQLP